MKTNTIKATAESAEGTLFLGDDWFDPLEAGVRTRTRVSAFLQYLDRLPVKDARDAHQIGFAHERIYDHPNGASRELRGIQHASGRMFHHDGKTETSALHFFAEPNSRIAQTELSNARAPRDSGA